MTITSNLSETTDSYFLKLTGKANIPEEVKIGENYKIVCEGTVTQKKEDDNFDGTKDITFKYEPVRIEITDELGRAIKAKDPRSVSQKIRASLWKFWYDEGYTEDFDSFYEAAGDEIMSLIPQLGRGAHKRNELK